MTKPLRVVAATDLSDRGEIAIRRAHGLNAVHGGALTVVHVIDEVFQESMAIGMRREAGNLIAGQIAVLPQTPGGVEVAIEIARGRPAASIAELCERTGAELLVAGAYRSDPLRDLLHGSTVHRALTLAETPALIAREGGSAAPSRVVAAVDFSIASERALSFARRLYPHAKIALVHALDLVKSAFIPGNAAERYRAQAQKTAEAELAAFARRLELGGALESMLVHAGEPADIILRQSALLGAEVVAMGTHGRTGIGHALLGSVALSVMDRANSDLLVVRAW